jgi:hypothetical protein
MHGAPFRHRGSGSPVCSFWSIRVKHVTRSAEWMFRGESCGWEAQIYRETDFTIGRRFILREEAAGWAKWMRMESEKEGA